jgi:SNF2 family DNA or RNA helicase
LQAQARCHRIGQTKAVHVYRLLCKRTYEMKMSERASHKLALDRAVLGSQQQGLYMYLTFNMHLHLILTEKLE